MALLGTFIDKISLRTLIGPTITTYNHSLGTTPDAVLAQVRSINASTGIGQIHALGGNASLLTAGVASPSLPSGGLEIAFDLFGIFFWSATR